jgi:hypothetical protein
VTIGAIFRVVALFWLSIFYVSLGLSSKTQNERGRMDQSPKRIQLLKVTKKWRIVMIFVLPIAQEALNHSTLPY